MLDTLESNELVTCNAADPPAYLPARDLSRIPVRQLLDAVRTADEDRNDASGGMPVPDEVEQVLGRLEAAAGDAVEHLTVKDLVASSGGPGSGS